MQGLYEAYKRTTKGGEQVRRLAGRTHPQDLPQDQTQIEGGGVNRHAFGDVTGAAQMQAPHSTGVIQMRETPLDQFATPSHQRLRRVYIQPPPIRIHGRLGRTLS